MSSMKGKLAVFRKGSMLNKNFHVKICKNNTSTPNWQLSQPVYLRNNLTTYYCEYPLSFPQFYLVCDFTDSALINAIDIASKHISLII